MTASPNRVAISTSGLGPYAGQDVAAVPQDILVDKVTTANVIYIGFAQPGSSTSDAVWRIMKIDKTGATINPAITWAGGKALYTNIYDNRASLSYS